MRAATDLDASGVEWALVGALAFGIRAEPRTTRDVDVAVAVRTERGLDDLIRYLFGRGYRQHSVLEQAGTGYLKAVRLYSPLGQESVIVDILHRLCGIEDQIVAAAEKEEILPQVFAPVATRGHLIAMKVAAWRDRDKDDAQRLVDRATDRDLRDAREALIAIERSPLGPALEDGETLDGRLQILLEKKRRGQE